MDKKAELGISTLVLTTAMILVAAVIFYVFVTSANDVNTDAKKAGDDIRENVGTAMYAVKLYAEDGSDDNKVDYFYFEVKPPYASDEIKLNDTLLVMSLDNTSREYTYNNSIQCNDTSDLAASGNAARFGVKYVNGAATYSDAVVAGELIRLCWKAPRSVEKDDKVVVNYFSKVGYNAKLITDYTSIMSDKTIYFFP